MSTLRDLSVALKVDTTAPTAAFKRVAEAFEHMAAQLAEVAASFAWPRFFVAGTAADPFARPRPLCIDGHEYRRRRNRRGGR